MSPITIFYGNGYLKYIA